MKSSFIVSRLNVDLLPHAYLKSDEAQK